MKHLKILLFVALAFTIFQFGCNDDTVTKSDVQAKNLVELPEFDPAGNQYDPTDSPASIERETEVSVRSVVPWELGDVFAGVATGNYSIYDNTGVLKDALSDGLGGFTTGSSSNLTRDKFYATNFSNSKVVVFDNAPPHGILQVIDVTANGGSTPESIVFATNGDFYVGNLGGGVFRYDPSGTFQQAYATGRADWIDLTADQQTLYYTQEGRRVLRYDLVNDVALADFVTIPTSGQAYALRLLPPYDGSGGLILADGAEIKRLDGSGAVIQTYDVTGENSWFAMNLDPNGTSIWGADFGTSNFYKFNISTGAVEEGPINTSTGSGTLFGLSVKGEITGGSGGSDADEDGVEDVDDNCPTVANPGQEDYDGDGAGDACDEDDDNDGVDDADDSDPLNEYVCRDSDGDGCDDCSSGTDDVNNDGPDNDGDGICDDGDPDDDNDGIADECDTEPFIDNFTYTGFGDLPASWICGDNKVKVCHIPPGNPAEAKTICIDADDVNDHLDNHNGGDNGDYLGECTCIED